MIASPITTAHHVRNRPVSFKCVPSGAVTRLGPGRALLEHLFQLKDVLMQDQIYAFTYERNAFHS